MFNVNKLINLSYQKKFFLLLWKLLVLPVLLFVAWVIRKVNKFHNTVEKVMWNNEKLGELYELPRWILVSLLYFKLGSKLQNELFAGHWKIHAEQGSSPLIVHLEVSKIPLKIQLPHFRPEVNHKQRSP